MIELPNLTENEIDDLLASGTLTIRQNIKWHKKKNASHLEFRAWVCGHTNDPQFNLQLVGTVNSQMLTNYSFALLMDKACIRRLDPNGYHRNRLDGKSELIRGTHKHRWSDKIRETLAYVPSDITDPKNIVLSFTQFLNECNISHIGSFDPPPVSQLRIINV